MVENVVGYFHRIQFTHFKVVVVSKNSASIINMKESIHYCGRLKGITTLSNIDFYESELVDYLNRVVAQNKDIHARLLFDFIEYNGGISKSADYMNHLVLLRQVLAEDGALGMTYFTKNKHEDFIRKQLNNINQTAFIPFSFETKRFIQLYLETHGLEILSKDEELIIFLGGEPAQRKYPPSSTVDLVPAEKWTPFSKEEVMNILSASGMAASAWIPTAYSHPYGKFHILSVQSKCYIVFTYLYPDKIKHYSVQKFQQLGISEEDFVHNYLTFFRHSLYAQPMSNSRCTFEPYVSPDFFLNETISEKVFVTDRLGSLGQSFAPLVESAKAGHSGQLGFAPYALNQKFTLDHTVSPMIAPSLALLSQTPSFSELLTTAVQFPHSRAKDIHDHKLIAKLLSEMLNFLVSINTITFIRQDGPLFSCSLLDSTPAHSDSSPLVTTVAGELEIQADRMRELGFDEDFINEALKNDNQKVNIDDVQENLDPTLVENNIKTKLSSILKILRDKTDTIAGNDVKKRSALKTIEKLRESVDVIPKSLVQDSSTKDEDSLKSHAELAKGVNLNYKSASNLQRLYRSLLCFQRLIISVIAICFSNVVIIFSLRKGVKNASCTQAKPVKRRTAGKSLYQGRLP
jgi:hypothetical protein